MQISDRQVPANVTVTMFGEPVLGQLGLEALSPRVASIMARWSLLEKQLDQIHTIVTDANDHQRASFDALKGWDRRFAAVITGAQASLSEESVDRVKAVLRLTEATARKRHELAHGLWAVAEGYEDCLTLLAPDSQHGIGKAVVDAKRAGTSRVPVDTAAVFEESRIVAASDLDQLITELDVARKRMEQLLLGYLYPAFVDETGKGFQDYRDELAADSEVEVRLKLMKRERQRRRKAGCNGA